MAVCRDCNVELGDHNWTPYFMKTDNRTCNKCYNKRHNKKNNAINNLKQRHLNSKYAKKKEHPDLYKLFPPGNYTLTKEGWYTPLKDKKVEKVERSKAGYIYICTNPAWEDWLKIGQTDDPDKRLKQFWTGTPHRDHEFVHTIETDNMDDAEKRAHRIAESMGERKNEWFKLTVEQAIEVLNNLDEHRLGTAEEANTDTPKDKLQERPIQADLWSYAEDREAKRVS